MIKFFNDYIKSISHLFYPELCISCNTNNREIDNTFCIECYSDLPFSNQVFNNSKDNKFTEHFIGKLTVEKGASLFYFVKQGKIQEIIKELKYRNKPQYGIMLGRLFGNIIINDQSYSKLDAIVPVPLHKNREQKRGYNQSLMFAKGISEVLNTPIIKNNLIRVKQTDTQTKMNRNARIKNLKGAFEIKDKSIFKNKHILLVDDVLTTGTTLLECGLQIKFISGTKLYLGTIAMGEPI